MSSQINHDDTAHLAEAVCKASSSGEVLRIRGSGSKFFYGRPILGSILDVSNHRGIISYEPSELVVTVRSGTTLKELEDTLQQAGQMLAFEPPWFGSQATIGGTIACGLSGPRRPFAGAARDFVLGVKIMHKDGEVLSFGGQVIKNVAGYDLSRLMTGALGTLGVLLEISLKVLPVPEVEQTLQRRLGLADALAEMSRLCSLPVPLSAASYSAGLLRIRLSGSSSGINSVISNFKADYHQSDNNYWQLLREHELDFFKRADALWRISLPMDTREFDIAGDWLVDWGGGLRWGYSPLSFAQVQSSVAGLGGHASIFRADEKVIQRFTELKSPLSKFHARLKDKFDPSRIFNPGIMYPDL